MINLRLVSRYELWYLSLITTLFSTVSSRKDSFYITITNG